MSDLTFDPKFYEKRFLTDHVQSILDFYQPNIVDTKNGGFHHNFYDDGSIFEPENKHLVSSCRIVYNYCKAYQQTDDAKYLELAKHGLQFIREAHWDESRNGFNWLLDGRNAVDQTNHCYGLAFVILCFATCYKTGLLDVKDELYRTWEILNKQFWLPESGLYADEASPDWSVVTSYRGQNANMHCCEALLLAFDATKDQQFLDRAYQLAKTIAVDLADKGNGLVWEHYTAELEIDWQYNVDDPKNLYRPWGYQPGHQTEWTKLLLMLHKVKPEQWMVDRAKSLFDRAVEICWDDEHGGLFYGHAPDNSICDDDKYFWVQAESFAAAALLYEQTQESIYLDWYNKIWFYSWAHFVDHKYGAWYRVLKANNQKYSNQKSTAGGKCDYHTMGACWLVLENMGSAK